ncbi:type III pantothenate kinase [Thiomicrorhabdus chilensis]|uniref:type III pantothenate kinase n=1 Tax=Thiomicrorhabdus chilensis TaxID=63656 RepID=UPI000403FA36|nr:type III pantothenate kinase [Thiomicrorhabdus chilensis]
MIDLFIDMGNSRIKFAVCKSDDYEYLGAFNVDETQPQEILVDLLADFKLKPDQIFVSSVASMQIEQSLREAIASVWSVFPVFLTTQLNCCGLDNGYESPLTLGVDRWMAMVAANNMCKQPFLVIDAGTAITVDAVSAGRHLGGFIVPGLTTMRESLGLNTANLDSSCTGMAEDSGEEAQESLFATNTQAGICGGTLYMAGAFIDASVAEFEHRVGSGIEVFVTGGDGLTLSRLIHAQAEYVEDLVLLGMMGVKESVKKS